MTDVPPLADPQDTSAPGPFVLYLSAPQERRRPLRKADAVVHLGEPSGPGLSLHHNFQQFWPLPEGKQERVQAFLMFALGVWAADKLVLRRLRPDAWTREFVVGIPTTPYWAEVSPELAPILNFLTGDAWTIQPRETQIDLGFAGTWPHSWQPTAVTLFSGGLDSLTGAIDLLEEGHSLVLVSHYDYGYLDLI